MPIVLQRQALLQDTSCFKVMCQEEDRRGSKPGTVAALAAVATPDGAVPPVRDPGHIASCAAMPTIACCRTAALLPAYHVAFPQSLPLSNRHSAADKCQAADAACLMQGSPAATHLSPLGGFDAARPPSCLTSALFTEQNRVWLQAHCLQAAATHLSLLGGAMMSSNNFQLHEH